MLVPWFVHCNKLTKLENGVHEQWYVFSFFRYKSTVKDKYIGVNVDHSGVEVPCGVN